MIGIKDQCFGVEIELTGITRAEAAEALAAYFETTPQRSYDNYDSWYVPDREGKQWRIMSDGSIRAVERRWALSQNDRSGISRGNGNAEAHL